MHSTCHASNLHPIRHVQVRLHQRRLFSTRRLMHRRLTHKWTQCQVCDSSSGLLCQTLLHYL